MSKLEYSRGVAAAVNRLEGAEFVVATARGSWEKLMAAGRYTAALFGLHRKLGEDEDVPAADNPRLSHLRVHYGSMSSFALLRQTLLLRNMMDARNSAVAAQSFTPMQETFDLWLKQARRECRRLSAFLPGINEPYDVLLDRHTPGLRFTQIARIEAAILPACRTAARIPGGSFADPRFAMTHTDQMKLAKLLLDKTGVDRQRAQIAWNTGAPFCRGHGDGVKIVMRDRYVDFTTMVLDLLHEAAGHGAYRQNTPVTCGGIVPGAAADETPALMLEHFLPVKKEFAVFLLKAMEEAGVNKSGLTADDMHRHLRKGRDNSRLDADLRTYPLYTLHRIHVVRDLVNGTAEAKDLPKLWQKYEAQLGLPSSSNDETACLQDLQMFTGYAGYFGNYLPALMAAGNVFEAMITQKPEIDAQLLQGDFSGVARWLKDTIHLRGAAFTPDTRPDAFIRHIHSHTRTSPGPSLRP